MEAQTSNASTAFLKHFSKGDIEKSLKTANVLHVPYFPSDTILRYLRLVLGYKMQFENFQSAVIPLEVQTSNASTAVLKHFFKR